MTRVYSRRFLLAGLLATTATAAGATAPSMSARPVARPNDFYRKVDPTATDIVVQAGLSGVTGFAISDVTSGVRIEQFQEDKALPPASVSKMLTALYGLDQLGAGFRFNTRLISDGAVEAGTLRGDLWLVGGGDPTLNTDDLGQMIAELHATGVRRIEGSFYVQDSALPSILFTDRDQPDYLGYNPTIGGMNLNFNRVRFEWRRGADGYRITMDARAKRHAPAVEMATMRIVSRDFPVYGYALEKGRDAWTVSRSALGGDGARWLPVRQPALYAADVFGQLANAKGVSLPAGQVVSSTAEGRVLVQHSSVPLSEMCRDMLKLSTNLTAEVIGLQASGAKTLMRSAAAMNAWAKERFGVDAQLIDHSGLGDRSRIGASDLVQILVAASDGPIGALMKPIKVRDANGKVMDARGIQVTAKTGTLNFVSTLAGYITAAHGTKRAFAIVSADLDARDKIEKSNRERPLGASGWNRRAKVMQQRLLHRWARA
jgi:D-alanyl-D-alanine carboxypeptidase/D-alanyl-D-alanine-endopeptidase (penicillin-binding protein 4)